MTTSYVSSNLEAITEFRELKTQQRERFNSTDLASRYLRRITPLQKAGLELQTATGMWTEEVARYTAAKQIAQTYSL